MICLWIKKLDKWLKICYNVFMKMNALIFDFFPAIYDTETGEVHVDARRWQNGLLLTLFVFLLKVFNLFYEPFSGGDHLKFRISILDNREERLNYLKRKK